MRIRYKALENRMLNLFLVLDEHVPGAVSVAAVGGERPALCSAGVGRPAHGHGVVDFHPTWLKDTSLVTFLSCPEENTIHAHGKQERVHRNRKPR